MNIGSAKGCDGFLKLKEREYLSVVLESGLSEPLKDLREDARLWLWGTQRVNICDCHWAYRNQGSAWEASRDDCGGEEAFRNGSRIQLDSADDDPADDDPIDDDLANDVPAGDVPADVW